MQRTEDQFNHVQLEIIGQENPLTISMSNYNNIAAMDLEQFYYKPNGTAPTNFIGINAQGTRGRYNQFGLQTNTIKTIPNVSGIYSFQNSNEDSDSVRYLNNGTDLIVSFVDKNVNSLNPTLITFDNNYLLNISLILS